MKITQTMDPKIIARLNEHVQKVHVKLYPEHFKPYNYEEILSFFKPMMEKPQFRFILLEDKGDQVGYAWIETKSFPESPFKNAYKSLYVHQISVNEEYRKKGYGSYLFNHIYQFAKESHINRIELDYWCGNLGAKRFYEKEGFIVNREFVFKEL
ncbi:GNAT family N-acetyltransferase [Bacillus timonensis]|nr:GNAT family N-acetyltransferase [Bacillus timonensis]